MKPGDLVFVHNKHVIGKAIRLSEWLRFRSGAGFNHTATLVKPTGFGNDWWILQANEHGVTWGVLSDLSLEGSYCIVPAPVGVDTVKQLAFLQSQVGDRYGFLTIASIVTTLLFPKFVNVMLPNTWICSALAAEALRAGGWIHSWPDLYQVNPAQLFETLNESE